MRWLLLCCWACADRGATRVATDFTDPTEVPTLPTSVTTVDAGVAVPTHVSLPFVSVGEAVPSGSLVIRESGGGTGEDLVVDVTGDFTVTGDRRPLVAGETRALAVGYSGDVAAPHIANGTAHLAIGALAFDIALAAVVGDPALPFPAWKTDAWGTQATAPFPSAPFPAGDASVLVFLPTALTDRGDLQVVTHLHGFYAELARTIPDQGFVELHAMSGRDAIFLAPQGPVDEASGDFGQLEDADGHARLVRDVVSALYRDGLIAQPVLGRQVLTSHSGGYAAAASLLDHGGTAFSALFLYDSVYGYTSTFEDFANAGGVLFSNYTAGGGTDANNAVLYDGLVADGLVVADDFRFDRLLASDAVVGFSASEHNYAMRDGRTHARWLAASPLRRSPLAAPELVAAVSDGGVAALEWRADRLPDASVTRVEGSDDGAAWETLWEGAGAGASVEARAWVRLVGTDPRFGAGLPGDSYAAGGGDWLVVDGFHRVFGGSYSAPTHDFAARVGTALGGASTVRDDAISEGAVQLDGWGHVLWLLGDESTADVTFDADARAAIAAYLAGGGKLVVSGSELGYATDATWLRDVLGVTYVQDDAGTDRAGGYTFGVVYPEDYPDVLAADETLWTYATGGGAAVGHAGQVVAVGFPLETLSDRDLPAALAELTAWLGP